jgi:nickel transport protein
MNRFELALITVVCVIALPAAAHNLEHEVTADEAVIVAFFFGEGSPFSYEQFEVYREGETIPFQTGRTDALGRMALLPDRAGKWRIKVHSEEGHGAELALSLDEQRRVDSVPQPFFVRHAALLAGLGIILGTFGLISLLMRRTK